MKIDYEIKNEKIIFNKEGVYFSVPVEQIDEFIRITELARTQYVRNETREQTEEYLRIMQVRADYGVFG